MAVPAEVPGPDDGPAPTVGHGVPVLARHRPGAEVTTVSVWLLRGSRHEDSPGLTHLLEHVLVRAAPPGRPAPVDELEALGAEVDAVTTRDHLVLHARVPSPEAAEALDVLARAVTAERFDEDLVATERRVVDEELRLAASDPHDAVHDGFFRVAFAGQRMGEPVGGTPGAVARLGAADLGAWAARHRHAGTVAVVTGGALTEDDVLRTLAGGPLTALPPAPPSAPRPGPPDATSGRIDLALNSDTTAVVVGGHAVALDDPRLPAAEVLLELLAGSAGSLLHEELRTRRGLCYEVWGLVTGYRDAGVWRVALPTAPEHRDRVVELACDALAGAAAEPRRLFDAARVAVAARRTAALARLDAESSLEEVLRRGRHRLVGGDHRWTVAGHAAALRAVTAGEVAACARTLLDRLVVATAGGAGAATAEPPENRKEGAWSATPRPADGHG
ncbi:MAG TPA: pitrilysin family protein [Pseudonocardiaceae bacterium]